MFKVLLLIDNAAGHPGERNVAQPNVKVIFLSHNTTFLIQSLDQGVISTFKTYYIHCTFRRILDAMRPRGHVGQCFFFVYIVEARTNTHNVYI